MPKWVPRHLEPGPYLKYGPARQTRVPQPKPTTDRKTHLGKGRGDKEKTATSQGEHTRVTPLLTPHMHPEGDGWEVSQNATYTHQRECAAKHTRGVRRSRLATHDSPGSSHGVAPRRATHTGCSSEYSPDSNQPKSAYAAGVGRTEGSM